MKMPQMLMSVLLACFMVGSMASSAAAAEFKVGLVLDRGGKDDKSFNASAYKGMMKAKDELKVSVKHVEAGDDNALENMLRSFAKKKYDLIIGVGFVMQEAVKKIAGQFPTSHFAIVDSVVDLPNVRSLMFQEHEGSYLVGAIAAMKSETGTVGFIGGMDIPLIRRFQKGYEAGVKAINPKAKILVNYVGVDGSAWNNPPKARELAYAQYQGKADVIFGAAGASCAGLFDAAEEKKHFAIGVDSNQNWVKPGFILTSMLKRVDVAVYDTIRDAQAGKFQAGTAHYGLANGGIDYAVDQYNDKILPKSIRTRVDKLKADIISGKIKVPDLYKEKNG